MKAKDAITQEPVAHVWFHRGLPNLDHEEALSAMDDGKGTPIALYAAPVTPAAPSVPSVPAAPQQEPAWEEAQRICDLPIVDEAIRGLMEDPTGDNATCMVRAILAASHPQAVQRESILKVKTS